MTATQRPIAVVDSGVGGLTVTQSLERRLPHENIVYLGDEGHGPYGDLSLFEVRRRVLKIADQLIARGGHVVMVAGDDVITPPRSSESSDK